MGNAKIHFLKVKLFDKYHMVYCIFKKIKKSQKIIYNQIIIYLLEL